MFRTWLALSAIMGASQKFLRWLGPPCWSSTMFCTKHARTNQSKIGRGALQPNGGQRERALLYPVGPGDDVVLEIAQDVVPVVLAASPVANTRALAANRVSNLQRSAQNKPYLSPGQVALAGFGGHQELVRRNGVRLVHVVEAVPRVPVQRCEDKTRIRTGH